MGVHVGQSRGFTTESTVSTRHVTVRWASLYLFVLLDLTRNVLIQLGLSLGKPWSVDIGVGDRGVGFDYEWRGRRRWIKKNEEEEDGDGDIDDCGDNEWWWW